MTARMNARMNAHWIKKEDNSKPQNPWVSFSLINDKTGLPSWSDAFLPNEFHYCSYPEQGYETPLLVVANFITPYKPRVDEETHFSQETTRRTSVFYRQPGTYSINSDEFFPQDGYRHGETFVETILQNNKRGFGVIRPNGRQSCAGYDANGELTHFVWPLSEHRLRLQTAFSDGTRVDVKGENGNQPLSFVENFLETETNERAMMLEWFAGNLPGAKFPVAKRFDFSHVTYDMFKPVDGKDNAYRLEL